MRVDDLDKVKSAIGKAADSSEPDFSFSELARISERLDKLNRLLLDERAGLIPQLLDEVRGMRSDFEAYRMEQTGAKEAIISKSDYEKRITLALKNSKLTFTELLMSLGVSKPTLSKYLKKLEKEGRIVKKRSGRRVEYRLI